MHESGRGTASFAGQAGQESAGLRRRSHEWALLGIRQRSRQQRWQIALSSAIQTTTELLVDLLIVVGANALGVGRGKGTDQVAATSEGQGRF